LWIGDFEQDAEDVQLSGGKENRDADVVDLLEGSMDNEENRDVDVVDLFEGSMDNEERQFGEKVGIRPQNSNV
jgi:hypothetical protein